MQSACITTLSTLRCTSGRHKVTHSGHSRHQQGSSLGCSESSHVASQTLSSLTPDTCYPWEKKSGRTQTKERVLSTTQKKLLKGTAGSIHDKPLQASASCLETGRIRLKGAIFQAEEKVFWLWRHQVSKEYLLTRGQRPFPGDLSHIKLQVLPTAGCNVSLCSSESLLTVDC